MLPPPPPPPPPLPSLGSGSSSREFHHPSSLDSTQSAPDLRRADVVESMQALEASVGEGMSGVELERAATRRAAALMRAARQHTCGRPECSASPGNLAVPALVRQNATSHGEEVTLSCVHCGEQSVARIMY